jgi:uncharacterized ferritin-like protein (DUF455 family)
MQKLITQRERPLKMINQENIMSILQPTLDIIKKFDWRDKHAYANWTAQTYYMVNHTTRLFAYSIAKTPVVHSEFRNRYIKHMQEEHGHENLAITDLKAMGYSLKDFPELPSTAAMYQTQYYWINEVSAYAFMGYIVALEGLGAIAGGEIKQILSEIHKGNATKFIKVHSEEDLDHIEDAYNWFAKIPAREQQHAYTNTINSVRNYGNVLLDIAVEAQKSRRAS